MWTGQQRSPPRCSSAPSWIGLSRADCANWRQKDIGHVNVEDLDRGSNSFSLVYPPGNTTFAEQQVERCGTDAHPVEGSTNKVGERDFTPAPLEDT